MSCLSRVGHGVEVSDSTMPVPVEQEINFVQRTGKACRACQEWPMVSKFLDSGVLVPVSQETNIAPSRKEVRNEEQV